MESRLINDSFAEDANYVVCDSVLIKWNNSILGFLYPLKRTLERLIKKVV